MFDQRATTITQAETQEIKLPTSLKEFEEEWRAIAGMIDGYEIMKEMRRELHEWGDPLYEKYSETKNWDHLTTLLDMRLMLFYLQRMDYHSGITYHECDAAVDTLFQAMSKLTGQPYQSVL